ncbi:MAG: patatin-like phospholipase family protein [Nonlabens sp.]
MNNHRLSTIAVIIIVFFYCIEGRAQKVESNSEPKIGLVLSGGGAKGFAHIGVLKVIDSLGIKVDYIAGTSMGAIVGGLYASGYTGKQLDSIMGKTDFSTLIIDELPRQSKTFYERRNDEKYAVTLPFKNFQVRVPSSLSAGQNFYNLLSQLLSPVGEVTDFMDLPIPFFCMATDVLTGEAVVLDSGYLPRAINASAALPSLLSPVEIGDRLFIDGGVTNNYPIEELRERVVDFIIGVDVQDDLKTRDDLESGLEILSQVNNFRTIEDMKKKAPLTDLYIKPDITSFTVTSFGQENVIIEKGKVAAMDKLAELKKLATSSYHKKSLKTPSDTLRLDDIILKGNDRYSRAYILGRFKVKTPGLVTYEQINSGISNLQATRNFTKINYVVKSQDNVTTMTIEVRESDVQNYLRLGLHYDNLFQSAAIVNLTRKNIIFGGDILSGDLVLGDNPRYNLDYYIDKGRYWSIGLHSDYVGFQENVRASIVENLLGFPITGINSVELEYREFTHQFYVQTQLARQFNVTLGAEIKNQNAFTETISTINPGGNRSNFVNQATGSLYGKVLLDSFDNLYFANSGWQVAADYHFYTYENPGSTVEDDNFEPHSIASIDVRKAYSLGKFSLRGQLMAGITIGQRDNAAFNFFLGGYGNRPVNNILPFFGYDYLSLTGEDMIKAGLEFDYELFKKHHLLFTANYASIEDDLFDTPDWLGQIQYSGYAVGYGVETFLGPVSLRYSFTTDESSEGQLFVNLGFRF